MELVNGWLDTYGDGAVVFLFILAFAEACVVIGRFVSGALLLLLSSVLYSNDVVGLETIMLLGFMGATLGDHVGFYCGVFAGPGFHKSKWVVRHRSRLEKSSSLRLVAAADTSFSRKTSYRAVTALRHVLKTRTKSSC